MCKTEEQKEVGERTWVQKVKGERVVQIGCKGQSITAYRSCMVVHQCGSPRMSNVGMVMWYSTQSITCALEYTSSAAAGLQVPTTDQPLSLAA